MNTRNENFSPDRLTTVLFVIYLIALFWILLFKLGVDFTYMQKRSVNLVPFSRGNTEVMQIVLNVVICIPLGIYTGLLFKALTLGTKLFCFVLVSSTFEVLQ